MEFFSIFLILVLLIPIISYLSKKAYNYDKKRLPPEAAGRLPFIGHLHLLAGPTPPHKILGKMAELLGPMFTIKVGVHRTLVVNSWEIAKECLSTNDKAFANRPKALFLDVMSYDYAMFGASPYGDYWRQMRKIATMELLSNHRLEMLRHVREDEIKAAMQGLYQRWINNKTNSDSSNKLAVEMKTRFWDITLNVILKIVVGKRYVEYTDTDDEGEGWRYALRDFFELSGKFAVSDALPYLKWLDVGGVERAMKKTTKELDGVMGGWLEEHKQKRASAGTVKSEEEDFMDVLLSLLDDTKEVAGRDVDTVNKATCLALILAASDTTTTTLTWILSLLLNNPNVLKKVQQEIDAHVGKERRVDESDMKNLVYLHAVIKESLRLYPPAPLSVPHVSVKECTIGGYHIPVGTRLIVNVSKIHRDSRVWSSALEFQPERFLTTYKHIDVKGQNFELIPFSSGRRMCPGMSFALQVLNLTLANLLHSFDIETPSGKPVDMTESGGITNLKATPLDVLLTPRLPPHLY